MLIINHRVRMVYEIPETRLRCLAVARIDRPPFLDRLYAFHIRIALRGVYSFKSKDYFDLIQILRRELKINRQRK